jgi:hypothetical protein
MCFFGSIDIGTKNLTAPPAMVHRPESKSDFELRTSPRYPAWPSRRRNVSY